MRKPEIAVLIVFLLVFFITPADADIIYLRGGGKIEGEIISENEDELVVKKGTISVTIDKERVTSIERTSGGKPDKPDKPDITQQPAPRDAKALLALGKKHIEAGRYRSACSALRKAHKAKPESEEIKKLLTLAESLDTATRMIKKVYLGEAKEAAEKAFKIDPENKAVKKVMDKLAEYDKIIAKKGHLPGKRMLRSTKHFDIHHNQPYIASKVAVHAEECYKYLVDVVTYKGCKKPRFARIHIRIYRDLDDYKDNTGRMGQMFPALCTGPDEIVTYQGLAIGALKHEITHCIIHAYLPKTSTWIQEGFATGGYKRGSTQTYSLANRYISSKSFLPFDEFLKIKTMDEGKMPSFGYYMQSRMALEFLIYGRGGMKKFHKYGKLVYRDMKKAIKAYIREQKRKKVRRIVTCNVDFLEGPMRDNLGKVYGYDNLSELDEDLRTYIAHRAIEAPKQERAKHRKFTASWPYTAKYETKHFVMFTTSSETLAKDLLRLSEETFEILSGEFWDAGICIPGKTKIYLFDKKKHYAAYLKKTGVVMKRGSHLIPHFNPWSGAACVYREGVSKDWLYQATAHEVTHALTVNVMNTFSKKGCWIVEGIAHYIGMSVTSKTKKMELGSVFQTKLSKQADYFRIMYRDRRETELEEFIDYNIMGMNTVAKHVQCWGLFHFMQHGEGGKYRRSFHKYIAEACRTGNGGVKVFEKHIENVSLVETHLKMYAADFKKGKRPRR